MAYLLLAQYVIWLNDPVNAGAGYWPAAGITLVALLSLPVRRWGWIVGAVVVAEVGGDALHGYSLAASSWWAAGNVVEPVVAAVLLRRIGFGGSLARLGDLVRFLFAAVLVGPLVGATIGSIGTASEYGVSQLHVLFKWWPGDGLGVLVVAPFLLTLREELVPRRSRYEVAVLAAVGVVIAAVAFRNWHPEWDTASPYLVFLPMMWTSVRFGIRGAALTGLLVAEVANLSTALGYGPFHLVAGPDTHAVTVLQLFLGSALTAGLVIATLVHDVLNRTRLYERQRSVADALQVAMLPRRVPDASGVDIAARYTPAAASAGIEVGGDWYDVFALPDDATALVVGDVVGHDLEAAVVMGQLRNGLRSLLMTDPDPGAVLAALDRQLSAEDEGRLATVAIGVYRDGVLTWANAGHPPLLHVPLEGPVRYLDDCAGPILGVGLGDERFENHQLRLGRGDVVVAFTDGILEHRSWPLEKAFDHVADLVTAAASRAPDFLCDTLVRDGLDGRPRDDDACVLAMRRTD